VPSAIIDINITGVYHVTVMQDFSIIFIELLALGTHKKQENLRLIPNGVRYHMLRQICSNNLVVINEQFDYHPVVNDDEDYSSVVIESPFSPTHLERGGKSLVVGTAVKLKQNIELTVKVNGANIIDITYDFRTDSIYGNERVRRAVKGLGFGVITYSVYDKLINQCVFADYEILKKCPKKFYALVDGKKVNEKSYEFNFQPYNPTLLSWITREFSLASVQQYTFYMSLYSIYGLLSNPLKCFFKRKGIIKPYYGNYVNGIPCVDDEIMYPCQHYVGPFGSLNSYIGPPVEGTFTFFWYSHVCFIPPSELKKIGAQSDYGPHSPYDRDEFLPAINRQFLNAV